MPPLLREEAGHRPDRVFEPDRVRSASRCKAKLHMNETSSAAIATANQAGLSVDSRGQAPSTAMSVGSTR